MTIIHCYLFGIGNVGSTFVNQILNSHQFFKEHHQLDLRIVGLANSKRVLFRPDGIDQNWADDFKTNSLDKTADSFYKFAASYDEERIAIDATASSALSLSYPELMAHHFHIVTANKIANSLSQSFYDQLRSKAKAYRRCFEYETNVGAGLPVVAAVRNLKASGERITKIRGVFSGSLGYIFNRFSKERLPFSSVLLDALHEGYTEPDPREDLSGNDVARKVLVLAREIGLKIEPEDIEIEALLQPELIQASRENFIQQVTQLDRVFELRKSLLKPDEVLRHVGVLDVNTLTSKVSLVAVNRQSPLGQLQGSDGFFEIYSENYAIEPLTIKGAGAGKQVTARGLVSDVIKVSLSLKHECIWQ